MKGNRSASNATSPAFPLLCLLFFSSLFPHQATTQTVATSTFSVDAANLSSMCERDETSPSAAAATAVEGVKVKADDEERAERASNTDDERRLPVASSSNTSTSTASASAKARERDELQRILGNEDIKNTWMKRYLKMCVEPNGRQAATREVVGSCRRTWAGYEPIDFEVLATSPAVVRILRFLPATRLDAIRERLLNSKEVVSQGVEGHTYSPGHRGRTADGLWLLHDEPAVVPLYDRIRQITALSPAVGEDFLVLKYKEFGHYAPHFDHLEPMPPDYDDGWFVYFGNRLATALLLVEVADEGGGTLFPDLDLTIQPERGDLLLWFNADSNDRREELSLHAACPIQKGRKIAVSMWIRGNFQDGLRCTLDGAGYAPEDVVRRAPLWRRPGVDQGRFSAGPRPPIPRWVLRR